MILCRRLDLICTRGAIITYPKPLGSAVEGRRFGVVLNSALEVLLLEPKARRGVVTDFTERELITLGVRVERSWRGQLKILRHWRVVWKHL